MAQLSDDCFAFGGDLLSVDEALARIEARVVPVVEIEAVPLAEAAGRILAADRVAAFDLPPHANSAVDGYAVAFADLFARSRNRAAGRRPRRGRPPARPPDRGRGEAIRIFTGAPMPDGRRHRADAGGLRRRRRPGPAASPASRMGANRRHAGEDVAKGALALAAGRRLGPADLGLAAALGHDRLPVFRRLRVALLSTGDEVREPGTALPPGAIYDANRFMLRRIARGLGCVVTDLGILPDREAALRRRAHRGQRRARSDRDLGRRVDRRGGSRQGRDRARSARSISGGWRSSRVGRWRSARSARVPLIGLPGNPVAAIVTFAVLARPLILRSPAPRPRRRGCSRCMPALPIAKSPGRREYLRARLERDGDRVIAVKYPRDGAGILSSIVHSDGLVVIDEAVSDLAPGTVVDFLPLPR